MCICVMLYPYYYYLNLTDGKISLREVNLLNHPPRLEAPHIHLFIFTPCLIYSSCLHAQI